MDKDTLNNILQSHEAWLNGYSGGKRADLKFADLQGVNLQWANLQGADLQDADIQDTDLRCVDLEGANLEGANLKGANLKGANLKGVNLKGVNLSNADLQRANLGDADLQDVNLRYADLRCANLMGASLERTDTGNANLHGANDVPYIPMTCPDKGAFIAWKKAFAFYDTYIVKLLIPEDARRSSATGRKCRADKAVVLSIEPIFEIPVIPDEVYSRYDPSFAYKVGQTVVVPDFDTDRFNECSTGIHFFINRREAIDY